MNNVGLLVGVCAISVFTGSEVLGLVVMGVILLGVALDGDGLIAHALALWLAIFHRIAGTIR